MASSKATLPVELCMLIVEHLVSDRGLHVQTGLAALRLSSRMLHRLATPHFYKVIQLSHHSHAMSLVPQLQAQPELCKTSRAVWWNEEAPCSETQDIEIPTPYLLRFTNVDEVAYTTKGAMRRRIEVMYPIGLHFALRDVGAWCQPVDFVRPSEMVDKVQQTPTLSVSYQHAERDFVAKAEAYFALAEEWRAEHQGQSPPRSLGLSVDLGKEPSRGIWAMHIVMPGFRNSDKFYYTSSKTLTHLTITLYHHFAVSHDPGFYHALDEILNPIAMPLLQHLHIRCINFGARRGQPSKEESHPWGAEWVLERKERKRRRQARKKGEDAEWETESEDEQSYDMQALALKDQQQWLSRLEEVRSVIDLHADARVTFDAIELPGLREESLAEDVRKFTLQQWQERIYHSKDGPWKAPMTQSVRIDSLSGSSAAEVDENGGEIE